MSRIKVAQIGVCHAHAAAKMRTLRNLPDVFDVVGVVDDRASQAARHISDDLSVYDGLPRLTLDEALAWPGLQAVIIETANADLVPMAMRCLERGLPMHLDKPGSERHADFRALVMGCQERDLPLQMGYMFRHNPAMNWCKHAVAQGWLGEVFALHASIGHDYGRDDYQRCLGRFTGGIHYILGCHLLDLAIAMLGRPTRVHTLLQAAPGDEAHVGNHALSVLTYPQALATLWACSRQVRGLPDRRLKVCGTRGTFDLSPLERFDGQPLQGSLTLAQPVHTWAAGTHTLDFGVTADRYAEQFLELARIVTGRQPNPRQYDHDLLLHEVLTDPGQYAPPSAERAQPARQDNP